MSNHKIDIIFGGEGAMPWRMPSCSCGWEGSKHCVYSEDSHSNANEEVERHLRSVKGQVTDKCQSIGDQSLLDELDMARHRIHSQECVIADLRAEQEKDHVADASKMVPMTKVALRKLEHMGGTPCGVLVRNEAGALAAVSDMGRVTWLEDYIMAPVARDEDVALPKQAARAQGGAELMEKINAVSRRSLDGSVVMSSEEWNGIVELVEKLLAATPTPEAGQGAEPEDISITPENIRISGYSSKPNSQWVHKPENGIRIIHLPTGIEVTCDTERSQHRNKAIAMNELQLKLTERDQGGQGVEPASPGDPLPCPFCGSTDVGGAGGTVGCYRCPAEIAVQNTNTAYAVELWNNRVANHPQPAQQGSVPEGWRECLQEMVQAMHDYGMSVEEDAPYKHRAMMDRAHALLSATPQPEGDGWILRSNRLPAERTRVIGLTEYDEVVIVEFRHDGDYACFEADYGEIEGVIVAWMPLPNPIKKEVE